jgi:hypothetical protein
MCDKHIDQNCPCLKVGVIPILFCEIRGAPKSLRLHLPVQNCDRRLDEGGPATRLPAHEPTFRCRPSSAVLLYPSNKDESQPALSGGLDDGGVIGRLELNLD